MFVFSGAIRYRVGLRSGQVRYFYVRDDMVFYGFFGASAAGATSYVYGVTIGGVHLGASYFGSLYSLVKLSH